MPNYYVNQNAQLNGDHEVHEEGCSYMPAPQNRMPLGVHSNCASAVQAAKRRYDRANGCYHCSYACHTS